MYLLVHQGKLLGILRFQPYPAGWISAPLTHTHQYCYSMTVIGHKPLTVGGATYTHTWILFTLACSFSIQLTGVHKTTTISWTFLQHMNHILILSTIQSTLQFTFTPSTPPNYSLIPCVTDQLNKNHNLLHSTFLPEHYIHNQLLLVPLPTCYIPFH